jgi:hypothetical protein
LVRVWVLASCSSAFKAAKELLFFLGWSTTHRVEEGMLIVLFGEEMRVISGLGGGNRTNLLKVFREEEDLQ